MQLEQLVCRLDGGFGNQLFQYAAARSIADRLGCPLVLDARSLSESSDRAYGLNSYPIRAQLAAPELLCTLPSPRSSRMGRLKARMGLALPGMFSAPVFWPQTFAYDKRVAQISRPVYLVGYWQSERYFAWNRSRLLEDLRPLDAVQDPAGLRARINATDSVALHVRRGDYLSNTSAAAIHGVCDTRYYMDAIVHLAKARKNMELFVFSDDPQWVRQNFQFAVPTVLVDSAMGSSTQFDFEMMRHCRHHIISNSTYSWWAAWLAGHEDHMVVAPKRWFKDASIPAHDVVPENWVRL